MAKSSLPPESILTPENAAQHIAWTNGHHHFETLYHKSRDLWIPALLARPSHSWNKGGYVALVRETQRRSLDSKALAVAHPDVYETYSRVGPVYHLIINGPQELVDTPGSSESLTSPGYIEYLIQRHLPATEEMRP